MRRIAAVVAVAVATAALAGPAGAATPTAREFSEGISPASSPKGIAAGPDGNLWFTELNGDRIARITPSGTVTEFGGVADPNAIAAGPDGNLWFAGGSIGRITPSGTATTFPTGVAFFTSLTDITAGPDGNLWYSIDASRIGKMSTAGSPTVYSTGITGAPSTIVTGADGNLWFGEVDPDLAEPNDHKIGRITTAGTVTEFAIPDQAGNNPNGPRGIAAGPDGRLWLALGPDGIGRIDPSAPDPAATITVFPVGDANDIVAGPDGNLWFTDNGDSIGRITPSGTFTGFSNGITGPASVSDIAVGPDGNLWFTEFFSQRIGRMNTALDPARYTDRARIEVPAAGTTAGPADPYPAALEPTGLQGTVTEVSVRLNGLHHNYAGDVEVLLVGPQGQKALLLADSTDGSNRDTATGPVITFDDDGPTSPARLVSGIFEPLIGAGATTSFPAPAPAGPYSTALSVFDGTDPNGKWELFVVDDVTSDAGVITGGWSLDIQTTGSPRTEVIGPPVEVEVPGPATTAAGPGQTITVPGPTEPAPADATKPSLGLTGPAARTTLTAFRSGPRFTVSPDEAVTLDVTLSVKPRSVTIAAADDFVLYERTVEAKANGTMRIKAKPSARRLGRPKKAFRAALRIVATDAAGNRTSVTRRITVNPDKKTKRSRR